MTFKPFSCRSKAKMQKEYTTIPLFAKTLYFVGIKNIDLNQITKTLEKEAFGSSGRRGSLKDVANISGASLDKYVLKKKPFKALKKIIEDEFTFFKNEILQYHKTQFKMTTSWITKSKPGESSNYHAHTNCLYSGVVYFKVPEKSGSISFENFLPQGLHLVPTKYNLQNGKEYTFVPKPGMMILFPSELHHKILRNDSLETRLSVAFNFFPTGQIGNHESDSHLNIKVL